MKFESPLTKTYFIKRYKRFFVDVKLGEEILTAHLANTGTMKSCTGEDWETLLSFHDSPTRKLKYSVELIHNGQSYIGINTSRTNKIAIEGINNQVITELVGYETLKPEVKIGESRIDILLQSSMKPDCFVEVKNVTLKNEDGDCTFPDAVTERGLKHLKELIQIKKKGLRAVLLFVVQREDCKSFNFHQTIDPDYEKGLREALDSGVEVLVYQCHLSSCEIYIEKKMPIKI
jgi:sugar fermentation stimulation protein A